MATHSSLIVPAFDFREAEGLPIEERFRISLDRAKILLAANGYQRFSSFPCIPSGATAAELHELEARLLGMALPREYRRFLGICRYLKIDDGTEIGGLVHDGVYVTEWPWLSKRHRENIDYLVFANYWRYADGDQLMFDLTEPSFPVIAYLHEHGPLFEFYAPSFSLALWRLVHEADVGRR
jgi:hypothetical protein